MRTFVSALLLAAASLSACSENSADPREDPRSRIDDMERHGDCASLKGQLDIAYNTGDAELVDYVGDAMLSAGCGSKPAGTG